MPPFGHLFGLPVIVDLDSSCEKLARAEFPWPVC